MGQHWFMEEMSGMSSAYNFQHSTAWAQVGSRHLAGIGMQAARACQGAHSAVRSDSS